MYQSRDKQAKEEVRERLSEFLREHKGRRFVLDCGHKAIFGDGRSNTIIITAEGKTLCHNCGY